MTVQFAELDALNPSAYRRRISLVRIPSIARYDRSGLTAPRPSHFIEAEMVYDP